MKFTDYELGIKSPAEHLGVAQREIDANERLSLLQRACEISGSQSEVARHIGSTPVHVSRWMNEVRPIPESYVPQLTKLVEGEL